MYTKSKKGFTLIELLIIIFIIALLAGILIPTLTRGKKLSEQAVCMAQLSGIGKAIELYIGQYNCLPWAREISARPVTIDGAKSIYGIFQNHWCISGLSPAEMFQEHLADKAPYIKDTPISKALEEFAGKNQFKCPADKGPGTEKLTYSPTHVATLKTCFNGKTYFEYEGTSYSYMPYWLLEATEVSTYQDLVSSQGGPSQSPSMNEFEAFHLEPQRTDKDGGISCNSSNTLYIDGHVTNNRHYVYKLGL